MGILQYSIICIYFTNIYLYIHKLINKGRENILIAIEEGWETRFALATTDKIASKELPGNRPISKGISTASCFAAYNRPHHKLVA